jgi:hypothetical protein
MYLRKLSKVILLRRRLVLKQVKKRTISKIIIVITMTLASTFTVFAASGSYSSTYDMTGGVFSKYITPKSKVTVFVSPTQGSSDCNMGVIWAKKQCWDGMVH